MTREGLPEEGASKQRPAGSEGTSQVHTGGKCSRQREGKYKDSEAGLCLACLWSRPEAKWTEPHESGGEQEDMKTGR